MIIKILKEALVVGIITGIIGFIVSTSLMFVDKKFTLKKYIFWRQVLFSYFITGIIIHLLFEAFGTNKWYCKNGAACQ